MKILFALFIIFGLLIAAVAAFVWSGRYNVAATVPHWGITHWVLGKVRERSIAVHSKSITPPSLDNPKLVDSGFREYHPMCRLCHGAPGYSRTEIAKGLYPAPPDLTSRDVLKRLNDTEIYWVIRNGIKMTGMPAFGKTHSEDELWAIVAFVKRLPDLKPDEYSAMVKATRLHDTQPHHHQKE
jgi:mono/diheme cytochrome c family protein